MDSTPNWRMVRFRRLSAAAILLYFFLQICAASEACKGNKQYATEAKVEEFVQKHKDLPNASGASQVPAIPSAPNAPGATGASTTSLKARAGMALLGWTMAGLKNTGEIGETYCDLIFQERNFSELLLQNVRTNANFYYMNFSSSTIYQGDWSDVVFSNSDLTNTIFVATELKKATFSDSKLEGTAFIGVDLDGVVFMNHAPEVAGVEYARNLAKIRIVGVLTPFVEQRDRAKKEGARQIERDFTAAIKRAEDSSLGAVERAWHYVLLDLPTAYGSEPHRAIAGILVGCLAFSLIYFLHLTAPSKRKAIENTLPSSALWVVWPKDRIRKDEGNDMPSPLSFFFPFPGDASKSPRTHVWSCYGGCMLIALYFSVLAAFHIGWKDLSVGMWISKLQPKEYTLAATGWLRTIAGFQSLLSVYLLAIWALTYFGRPFE